MDKSIIKINENGNIVEAEVIAFLESDDGQKQYILYTQNEKAPNGMDIIYFSELIKKNNDEYILEAIKTEKEKEELKQLLKQIVNNGKGE